MLREVITPKTQNYTIHIPLEYLNMPIEILVLPFSNKEQDLVDNSVDIIRKTAGLLATQKIDPIAWQRQIRDEWNDRECGF